MCGNDGFRRFKREWGEWGPSRSPLACDSSRTRLDERGDSDTCVSPLAPLDLETATRTRVRRVDHIAGLARCEQMAASGATAALLPSTLLAATRKPCASGAKLRSERVCLARARASGARFRAAKRAFEISRVERVSHCARGPLAGTCREQNQCECSESAV